MSMVAAAGIMSAGALLGQYMQAKSAERINQLNQGYQNEANQLSIDLANTAHQREIRDLRAAGLNPILSAGGSGAATPSIGAVQAQNPYEGLGHTAREVSKEIARLVSDQQLLSNDQIAAQTDNIRAQRIQIESDAELKKAMADSIRAGRNIFDLGSETIRPVAESIGEKIGNSAFSAWQGLKSLFRYSDNLPKRMMYIDGRYYDPAELWHKDPGFVEREAHKRIYHK